MVSALIVGFVGLYIGFGVGAATVWVHYRERGVTKRKYYIRYEELDGLWYYMIYQKTLVGHVFFQRCNSSGAAVLRLCELNGAG
jgi:hypothetical protein